MPTFSEQSFTMVGLLISHTTISFSLPPSVRDHAGTDCQLCQSCVQTARRRPSGKWFPLLHPKLCNIIYATVTKVKRRRVFHLQKFPKTEHLGLNNKKMDFQHKLLLVFPCNREILLLPR